MNWVTFKSTMREFWYLFILLAVAIAGALLLFVHEKTAPPKVSAVAADTLARLDTAGPKVIPTAPARPTEEEEARTIIADYQQKLQEDPKAPDAPAYLNAMGNLSQQKLGDYKAAAQCYELLLQDYPQWECAARVYPQLAICYERLNDLHNLNGVYKLMMEKFPPESSEYQYAKIELGM